MRFKDYYKIMGVPEGASQDEIKSAYRKLARTYHPDVNKAKDAQQRFAELGEAYEALGDEQKRKAYDELRRGGWREGQEFTPPPPGQQGWHGYQGQQGEGPGEVDLDQ